MALTTYCQYTEIRAILGTNDNELKDATLALPLYERVLKVELREIKETLPEDFETLAANPSRTADETRVYELTQVLSAYLVARELLVSLPKFSPTQITDGKAEIQREESLFEKTKELIEYSVDRITNKLLIALNKLDPTVDVATITLPTVFSGVGLATDPVTGA